MIAYKGREVRRARNAKMARNLERLYKEAKCRDFSVIVTRMDFAKILGKFTKVKIQYENVSSPKTKKVNPHVVQSQLKTNEAPSKVRTNENGVLLARRNAFNNHPINNSKVVSKKPRISESVVHSSHVNTPRQVASNVLKENNGLQITPVLKNKNSNYNTKSIQSSTTQYAIMFVDPKICNNKDCINKIHLAELVPKISRSILPSGDWCIDFLPKTEQSSDDKVYDRIEAELEGLMFSENKEEVSQKPKPEENKVDDFPSIMDILNDNYNTTETKQNDQSVIMEFKSNLESNDVEAMLLGKTSDIVKISSTTPMEVENSGMNKSIEHGDKDADSSEKIVELSIKENPQSPSILDGNLEKGIEEHIPAVPVAVDSPSQANNSTTDGEEGKTSQESNKTPSIMIEVDPHSVLTKISSGVLKPDLITDIIFRKLSDGKCIKTVSCPKNLMYSIEIEGKPVEFLGAPKFVSSIEDLQVLLQIVNESELDSLYVKH